METSKECRKCKGECEECVDGIERRRKRKIYYQNNREQLLEKTATYKKQNAEKVKLSQDNLRKKKPSYKRVFIRNCETCGEEFQSKNGKKKNCDLHTYNNSKREKEYRREYTLKRYFGITLDQYNILLSKQDNKCAICRKDASSFKNNLAVDHDHSSGEIRGLLCTFCNHRFIGRNKDADMFYRAAVYLQNNTGWFVPEEYKKGQKRKKKKKTHYHSGREVVEVIVDERSFQIEETQDQG